MKKSKYKSIYTGINVIGYVYPNQLFQHNYTQEQPEYNFYSLELNQPTIFDVSGLNKVSSSSAFVSIGIDPGGDPEPGQMIPVGNGLSFMLILVLIFTIIKIWKKN